MVNGCLQVGALVVYSFGLRRSCEACVQSEERGDESLCAS